MQWKALFVGDCVINKIPDTFLSAGFSTFMQEHSIRSCNFEAPVSGYGNAIKKAGPHLVQHQGAPALLEKAGFNVINFANNHIYDFGKAGLAQSLSSFRDAVCVGAGITPEAAYSAKQITVHDVKIGLLSFCEAEFGALTLNHPHEAGYAWINHPTVNQLVTNTKEQVNVLLIQCHAGIEQVGIPLPEWRARYRELIEAGADAIIGCHPHVPQGWEIYKGKPIFYSLGNFYFDAVSDHPLWNKGIAVSLVFEDEKLTGFEVTGIERTAAGVQLLHNDQLFEAHLHGLNEQLHEPLYSNSVQELALTLWNQYYRNYYDMALQGINSEVSLRRVLTTMIKRLFLKNKTNIHYALLLHNIRIESHRWLVERALEIKIK